MIATLILAHLLADFPLQTNTIAINKSKSLRGLLVHVFVYVAATWALLGFQYRFWFLVGCLGLSHFFVDSIKVKGNPQSVPLFILDQAAHLAFILVIGSNIDPTHGAFDPLLKQPLLNFSLLVAACLAVKVMFWLWANNLNDDTLSRYSSLRWGRKSLLELEQRTGFGLICFLGIGVMLIR